LLLYKFDHRRLSRSWCTT